MESPKLSAFCRIAPAVRFIVFEILATGVLLFECALRSRTCSFDQATRLVRPLVFFRLIAIKLLSCLNGRLLAHQAFITNNYRTPNTGRRSDSRMLIASTGAWLLNCDSRSSPNSTNLNSRSRTGLPAPHRAQTCRPKPCSAHSMNHGSQFWRAIYTSLSHCRISVPGEFGPAASGSTCRPQHHLPGIPTCISRKSRPPTLAAAM